MPYPGYRGYCYPDKCNGIPDADTQYVSKHNGLVNFANLQTPTEFAKMFPLAQFSTDLADGSIPAFSYIVPNECNDMHGAPPWCVDSSKTATVQQSWLMAPRTRHHIFQDAPVLGSSGTGALDGAGCVRVRVAGLLTLEG